MIIIDDCSNDGSLELVKDIAKDDLRIRLISLKNNLGPSNARNEGIKHYLCILVFNYFLVYVHESK